MISRRLGAGDVHYTWSAKHSPIMTIETGVSLDVETRDGFDGQFAGLSIEDLAKDWSSLDFGRIAPLTGPIFVSGVKAGDVVRVDLHEVEASGPGYTVVWPEWAAFDFVRPPGVSPGGRIFSYTTEEIASGTVTVGGVAVALRPMLGMVGVAPASGEFTTLPPRRFGGNLDCRLLTARSSVYLRAEVDGGLISVGDAHGAQGDGEMCTTAIECPAVTTITVRNLGDAFPYLENPWVVTRTHIVFSGLGTSLESALETALLSAHNFLVQQRVCDADEAYALTSLLGQAGVDQVVNRPILGARVALPLEIVPERILATLRMES